MLAGGFGRRASDGGANLHMYWSRPGSREQLASSGANGALPGAPQRNAAAGAQINTQLEHTQQGLDELADPYAVARYILLKYLDSHRLSGICYCFLELIQFNSDDHFGQWKNYIYVI